MNSGQLWFLGFIPWLRSRWLGWHESIPIYTLWFSHEVVKNQGFLHEEESQFFTLNGEPRYHPSSSKELSFVVRDEGVAFSWLLATTPRDALRLLDEVAAFSWLLATTASDALRLRDEVAAFSWLFAKNENSELSYKRKL